MITVTSNDPYLFIIQLFLDLLSHSKFFLINYFSSNPLIFAQIIMEKSLPPNSPTKAIFEIVNSAGKINV